MLLLSGTNVTALEIQDIIKDTFEHKDEIRPQDYLRDAQDHTFAAARNAVLFVRMGMCNDFDACVPTF